MRKRSNKPIFWSLFGAGGMLAALFGPVLVFITGIAVPLGIGASADAMSYQHALALAQSLPGKVALVAVIGLFLFHGCHRMYHFIHDFGVHVSPAMKAAFHGFAALGTLAALVLAIRAG
ncbi:MAG TPA: fumarate reductase subunit FrdD [Burkholderiaceae bacterium]